MLTPASHMSTCWVCIIIICSDTWELLHKGSRKISDIRGESDKFSNRINNYPMRMYKG